MIRRGLYFIANNKTYDLAIAFLNSVRTFEWHLPICFIPYDSDSQQIADLAKVYNFSQWEDPEALRGCDQISKRFHGSVLGQYRKLAIWNGPYAEFAYIDVDTVLVRGFERVWDLLREYGVICGTSNNLANRGFVWRDSLPVGQAPFDTEFAANTGVLFSKRGLFSWEMIEAAAEKATRFTSHMELLCAEQPFLNYLIVTSGQRYSSLRQIARETCHHDLPVHVWSGNFDGDLLARSQSTLLIHWAGEWQRAEHLRSLVWQHFRHLPDVHR